ncbi:MAG: FAD-dependent oxidoreductase [bacterium]|nr:FAD-dependent oxidoreductase [bacterium]
MNKLGSRERPLRVAIIGSGPSGFYAAGALVKSDKTVHVDMFDRLPSPYGLVRLGVAPDHEKIKVVIKIYERIAAHENIRFMGNVQVGKDVAVDELKNFYDALLFTCGAETDKKLGIPGEDLPGSYTATEFVAWYNGHPDYRDRTFDLGQEVAVVIGQGNVAMDVARILCKTVDELKHTDIAQHALDTLAESKVKEIHMIGRRGPVQAAFTLAEIKEMGKLADCDPVFNNMDDFNLEAACRQELEESKHAQKNRAIFQDFLNRETPTKSKKYVIHFFQSPVQLLGTDRLEKVVLETNGLSGEPFKQKARGTGEKVELPCGLLFRSIGYRGVPIEGVPFHESWGIFPNKEGRILESENSETIVPGLYTAGWIKRGPSGVIGTNKPDSIETANALLSDTEHLTPCPTPDSNALLELLRGRGVRVVSFEDWKKIDAAEIKNGEAVGKPREKFVTVTDMLNVLD